MNVRIAAHVLVLLPSSAAASEIVARPKSETETPAQATTSVTRADLDERLPRSAPDALRFEPGVFVQQTAHGQASVFLRGRTGQQTVLLFDGVRLNTSTFRQGPNQYFFTVDAMTIDRLTVTRGGASTRYGSDALGGAIYASPIRPQVNLDADMSVRPRTWARYQSADSAFGQRMQVDAQWRPGTRLLAGGGYNRVGHLRAGGPLIDPATGRPTDTPVFDTDGKTQLGTGYKEYTFDARAEHDLAVDLTALAAVYGYRQMDAPRTDQCPPPLGGGRPEYECLKFDEQYRTLAYVGLDGRAGRWADRLRMRASFQRQHEKRTRRQQSPQTRNVVRNVFRDDVNTLGLMLSSSSVPFALGSGARLTLHHGLDLYRDTVSSRVIDVFDTYGFAKAQPRGTYVEGSSYTHGGVFAEIDVPLNNRLTLRAGGRMGFAVARVPEVPEAASLRVNSEFVLVAGHAGTEVRLMQLGRTHADWVVHVDRSIRAPNLDDLSSRQQTGPGFQFENAHLGPEISYTKETGLRVHGPHVEGEVWAYRASLLGQMTRVARLQSECPAATSGCTSSRSRFQLINAAGVARIDGVEAALKIRLPYRTTLMGTVAYAYGAQPNPVSQRGARNPEYTVPISRIPPLNGTAELRVRPVRGAHLGAAFRWATLQDRLAISDRSDRRIPTGGTPGYAVWDARAGYRWDRELSLSVVFENLFDRTYRYHGSGLNAPGRGVIAMLEAGAL